MFDANKMCDSIIEDIKRIDYRMSRDDIQTIIHQNIDKYDAIFNRKSIEEKKLWMKECCCFISGLSTTILFDHDIDLTLNDCGIGVTSNNISVCDHTVDNVDNNNDYSNHNESVDNTCVKCSKPIVVVVVSDRNASQNDETSDEWQIEDVEPNRVITKKSKRRSKNKTGFPRPKKKIIKKSLNTKKDNRSANPVTDKSSEKINFKTKAIKNNETNASHVQNKNQNNNLYSEDDDNDTDNENEAEKYVKFMGSTFRARHLFKKCKSKCCVPRCELDELTLAFEVMMSAENDDDLPRDLRKQCRIDSNSDCSDSDNNNNNNNNAQQNNVNSNCDDKSDDLIIVDVNDIYSADKDWFSNDVLTDGVNDILAQTSNSTSQTLPFDQLLPAINYDQLFASLPSTSGYCNTGVSQPSTSGYCSGNTGFAPIINNVHTMSQKIIINNVMPTTSSIPSSDLLLSSELPQDLIDICMMDFDTSIACDSDAISITVSDPEVIATQSEITCVQSVTDNDEHTSDKSLDTTPESVVSNNDSDNNAVKKKKKAMKRSHDN